MKTVEEACLEAREKVVNEALKRGRTDNNIDHPALFNAGIDFAQQWISVEDELPPEDGFDYLLYNEKWEHADTNPSGIRFGFYSSGMDDNWEHVHYSMYIDEYITEHDAPTHWRPIEFK